ncbi:histidine phosphatase family protein [Iodobacter ciconiae]|uniref:Histidine phosphatase family protein n=1 Tax=Iodobacter ciconiae TaxID=2496266 RepID=A0A3S8ZV62_9NEIS|nr:histidine phosphatase family protein [Iodobacter ciconiae]AZN37349.1 histidine phosphatase family protein [Iodobacter ciconiae]
MSSFRLTLLRHGATIAPAGILTGHTDLPLSALGEQQMAGRNNYFSRFPPSSIASSDLCRCAGFARQLAGKAGLDCHIDSKLREMNFGELDGLAKAQWSEAQQAAWALWSQNPEANTGADIESWVSFSARVNAAFRAWLQVSHGNHRVMITHGGVAKALLLNWLGLPAVRHNQFWLAHAGMITLYWDDEYLPILQGIDNEVLLGA